MHLTVLSILNDISFKCESVSLVHNFLKLDRMTHIISMNQDSSSLVAM